MKNIPQDITPGNPNKRSIRDVSLPTRRGQSTADIQPKTKIKEPAPVTKSSEYAFDYDIDRPRKNRRWGLVALVCVFVLALLFGVSSLFASATLSVTPKTQTIPLQGTFSAMINQPAGQFGYQIVSVSSTEQKDVPAGAEAQVDTKATGMITVYNASQTNQNLVATTRFETSAGLIFRMNAATTVPKATTQNGQSVPGSVTVAVTADKSGQEYNVSESNFTLPGLAGTAQAKNVYGESQDAMTGGFSGMEKQVDPTDLATAQTALQQTLTTDLQNQITSQLPQDFILYPSSINYSFGSVSQTSTSTAGTATVSEDGTASAVIFDQALLSQAILTSVASSLENQGDANVSNLNSLTFALTQPTAITADYTDPISFTLTGDSNIVWSYDPVALKSDILGLKKDNLDPLLSAKYPTISSASAKIFPIWKESFPTDPNKITIVTAK